MKKLDEMRAVYNSALAGVKTLEALSPKTEHITWAIQAGREFLEVLEQVILEQGKNKND